jgi:hypothetical protein
MFSHSVHLATGIFHLIPGYKILFRETNFGHFIKFDAISGFHYWLHATARLFSLNSVHPSPSHSSLTSGVYIYLSFVGLRCKYCKYVMKFRSISKSFSFVVVIGFVFKSVTSLCHSCHNYFITTSFSVTSVL